MLKRKCAPTYSGLYCIALVLALGVLANQASAQAPPAPAQSLVQTATPSVTPASSPASATATPVVEANIAPLSATTGSPNFSDLGTPPHAADATAKSEHAPTSPPAVPVSSNASAPLATLQSTTCQNTNTVTANVVALDQPFMLNRLGAAVPQGMIFALMQDVVPINGPTPGPGNAMLRSDKRPRPIVLRVNKGGCLQITF